MRLTKKQKETIDEMIGFACKEGYLDSGDAQEMSWEEKKAYYEKALELDGYEEEPI